MSLQKFQTKRTESQLKQRIVDLERTLKLLALRLKARKWKLRNPTKLEFKESGSKTLK